MAGMNWQALSSSESSRLLSGETCEVTISCDYRNLFDPDDDLQAHPRLEEIIEQYQERVLSNGRRLVVAFRLLNEQGRTCDQFGEEIVRDTRRTSQNNVASGRDTQAGGADAA
jgi:hypothetical protein